MPIVLTPYTPGSSFLILDPEDEATGNVELDLMADPYGLTSLSAPSPQPDFSTAGSMDTEGDAIAARRHQNRRVTVVVDVTGDTTTLRDEAVDALAEKVAKIYREGGTLRYVKPDATYRTLDLLAADSYEPELDIRYFLTTTAQVSFSFVAKPYARGPQATYGYVSDDFSTDTVTSGDWLFDAGTGTLSVSGGQLVPSSTASKRIYQNVSSANWRVSMKLVNGGTVPAFAGVIVKRLDASNFLYAGVAGTGTSLVVAKTEAGVASNLASTVVAMGAGTTRWIRAYIEDNKFVCELWTSAPTPTGTPANTVTSSPIAPAVATLFGTGITGSVGIYVTPGTTSERYDDFLADAFFETTTPALILTPQVDGDVDA